MKNGIKKLLFLMVMCIFVWGFIIGFILSLTVI